MKRARGFTLVEIMIALVLSSLVSLGILYLARGQLRAHEISDQLMRTQGNVRAGMQYVETVMRRACGGVTSGLIAIDVNGVTPQQTTCIRVWDGATPMAGSFTSAAPTTAADALEIIYPISSPTAATDVSQLNTSSPQISVGDVTGFSVGDYVLVTDDTYGDVFKVASVATPTAPKTGGVITFDATSAPLTPTSANLAAGSAVFRVASIAIYVDSSVLPDALMLDPDGMLGSDHTDADPLVDGVVDFQVAVGEDLNGDGTVSDIPDEWLGNQSGELSLSTIAATPWTTLRLLRATIAGRTTNTYPGAAAVPTGLEDRDAASYVWSGAASPRYRIDRVVVAPRAWSMTD